MGRTIAPSGRTGTTFAGAVVGAAAVLAIAALNEPTVSRADGVSGFDDQDLQGAYGMIGTAVISFFDEAGVESTVTIADAVAMYRQGVVAR